MPISLRFLGAASILIDLDGYRILCDPWLFGVAFEGAWARTNSLSEEALSCISDIDLIYLSHIHSDHYHVDSLRYVLRSSPGARIIITDLPQAGFFLSKLRADGFTASPIKVLNEGYVTVEIIPDHRPPHLDTILVARVNDTVIINSNDFNIDKSMALRLSSLRPSILCHKYNYPGPYPALFHMDPAEKDLVKSRMIEDAKKSFKERHDLIAPLLSVPFAGTCQFSSFNARYSSFRSSYDSVSLKRLDPLRVAIPREDGSTVVELKEGRIRVLNERASALEVESVPLGAYQHEKVFCSSGLELLPWKYYLSKAFSNAFSKFTARGKVSFILYTPVHSLRVDLSEEPAWKGLGLVSVLSAKQMCDEDESVNSIIMVSHEHFICLLLRVSHWDNAIAGSIAEHYRPARSSYDPQIYQFLNHFHV